MGKYGQKIYSMLKMQVKSFADYGFNVIVDYMSLEDDYDDWRTILDNHELIFCGITANNDELDRRENERKDRVIGVARAHSEKVHQGYDYDIFIDTTTLSSIEAAKKIQKYIS
jgi:chloramphenicol 3-O phosphotransferase